MSGLEHTARYLTILGGAGKVVLNSLVTCEVTQSLAAWDTAHWAEPL